MKLQVRIVILQVSKDIIKLALHILSALVLAVLSHVLLKPTLFILCGYILADFFFEKGY